MLAGVAVVPLFVAHVLAAASACSRGWPWSAAGCWSCVPALFEVYTASREGRPLDDVVDDRRAAHGARRRVALGASLLLVAVRAPHAAGRAGRCAWIRRAGVARS